MSHRSYAWCVRGRWTIRWTNLFGSRQHSVVTLFPFVFFRCNVADRWLPCSIVYSLIPQICTSREIIFIDIWRSGGRRNRSRGLGRFHFVQFLRVVFLPFFNFAHFILGDFNIYLFAWQTFIGNIASSQNQHLPFHFISLFSILRLLREMKLFIIDWHVSEYIFIGSGGVSEQTKSFFFLVLFGCTLLLCAMCVSVWCSRAERLSIFCCEIFCTGNQSIDYSAGAMQFVNHWKLHASFTCEQTNNNNNSEERMNLLSSPCLSTSIVDIVLQACFRVRIESSNKATSNSFSMLPMALEKTHVCVEFNFFFRFG